jgi:hypothetical protein
LHDCPLVAPATRGVGAGRLKFRFESFIQNPSPQPGDGFFIGRSNHEATF